MVISLIHWYKEIAFRRVDLKIGLNLSILTELNGMVAYLSVIAPHSSIKPHYHKKAGQHRLLLMVIFPIENSVEITHER